MLAVRKFSDEEIANLREFGETEVCQRRLSCQRISHHSGDCSKFLEVSAGLHQTWKDVLDELSALYKRVEELEDSRPATHQLLLGEDRWSVKHPLSCPVLDCFVPDEDLLEELLVLNGQGCVLVETEDGWVRAEELHEDS